jgi:membrane protein
MNKVRDFASRQLDNPGAPDDALVSYRPVYGSMADMVGTPVKVTGAVLGAAALGYLALMKKRRTRPARTLTPQEAAHRLAAKPAPGMPGGRLPLSSMPLGSMAVGPMPVTRTFAGDLPAKQRRSAKRRAAAAKAGAQPGAFRQIVNTGRSLLTLFRAFSAYQTEQSHQTHVDPAPAPPVALPAPPAAAPVKSDAQPTTGSATAPGAQPAFKPVPQGSFLTRAWHLIKAAVSSWVDDFAPSMGAALSYYTVFSLAPMLLIVIGVAGLVFGADAARGEIVAQLRGMMGEQGAVAVEELLKSASDPGKGILATVIGFVTLLIGATAVFAELQSSLDRIWRTPAPANENGIWGIIRTRFLSFGLILGLGFLMIVSLVLSAALAAMGTWFGGFLGDWELILQAVNFVVSFGVVTLVFAAIYKFMPHAKIDWPNVWVGALVTALLFTIGKFLISLYIGKSGVASGFGAAGSFAVLLVWVYYSAQIFLLGAEFTWVYSHRNAPPPDAAPVPVRNDAPPAAPA